MEPKAGFTELEHTADWELRVWAPDLASLFEQSARGMYTISGTVLCVAPRQSVDLSITALDNESLLVKFLTALLVLGEQKRLAFDQFELSIQGDSLSVHAEGAPICSQDKEIKAVTYHGLQIKDTEDGLSVNIVFDV